MKLFALFECVLVGESKYCSDMKNLYFHTIMFYIQIACDVIAGLLHYLFLCVFGWMLAEGLHLYIKIVKVYGAEESRLRYYFGIGWGLPIPVVVFTAGIRSIAYSSPTRYGVVTAVLHVDFLDTTE